MWASLTTRRIEPELMDDPGLDPAAHHRALRGLARLNWLSRPVTEMWPPIRAFAQRQSGPLRLLDVACGGGDVTLALWRRAQRRRLPIEVHGCDISATALAHARETADRAGAKVNFHRCDVLGEPLPEGYHIITCALFLHHLTDEAIVQLLDRMRRHAALVVISDLRRTRLGLIITHLATRLMTRSRIVHVDGPRSVRAALTIDELRALTARAGMTDADVRPCFPERMRLVWHRD